MPRLHSVEITGGVGGVIPRLILGSQTAIIGNNGSGKTHILEAIHSGAGGTMNYAIEHTDTPLLLQLIYGEEVMGREYQLQKSGRTKTYTIQGKKYSSVQYLEQLPFRTVLFSPFDMNLLYFAPSYRREMIDSILTRAFAQFRGVKREYEAILRQRNAVLRQIRDGESSDRDLDLWDAPFLDSIQRYDQYRMRWSRFIEDHLEVVRTFLPKYEIRYTYQSHTIESETLKECDLDSLFREKRSREIAAGHTLFGPHLDDFSFLVRSGDREYDASLFLSRWENKVLLLALKYLEILFLESVVQKPVILLFDDLFAELDPYYTADILSRFSGYQMLFTAQVFPEALRDREIVRYTLDS